MDKCISIKLPTGIVRLEANAFDEYEPTVGDAKKLEDFVGRITDCTIEASQWDGWVLMTYGQDEIQVAEIHMQYGDEFPV